VTFYFHLPLADGGATVQPFTLISNPLGGESSRLPGLVTFVHTLRHLALGLIASLLLPAVLLSAQSENPQQAGPSLPTFRITTSLVFLDVTVLNKQGQPVVSGLTRNDFHVTEDRKPRHISSFEAPHLRLMGRDASERLTDLHGRPTRLGRLDSGFAIAQKV
jgi:hypothetical protein